MTYTSKTTGSVRKLVGFECPNCGDVKEDFEGEVVLCWKCETDPLLIYPRMTPIFSPKSNQQRVYIRDERK